jgi:glyoxalase/bleomycin resistance protein/dioxygenase superfamily protein
MAVLTGVSPVLLVADLQRSVDYFSNRLGFECHVFGDPPNFATAARDAAVILIALSDQPERLVPHWQIVDKMWDAYVRVDDVDAIYAEVNSEALASTTRSTTPRTAFASSAYRIPMAMTSRLDSGSRHNTTST